MNAGLWSQGRSCSRVQPLTRQFISANTRSLSHVTKCLQLAQRNLFYPNFMHVLIQGELWNSRTVRSIDPSVQSGHNASAGAEICCMNLFNDTFQELDLFTDTKGNKSACFASVNANRQTGRMEFGTCCVPCVFFPPHDFPEESNSQRDQTNCDPLTSFGGMFSCFKDQTAYDVNRKTTFPYYICWRRLLRSWTCWGQTGRKSEAEMWKC